MEQHLFQQRNNERGFSIGRVQLHRQTRIAEHHHPLAHLLFVYSGIWIDRADCVRTLRAGEMLFHPANFQHSNEAPGSATDLIVAEFDRDFVAIFCPLYGGIPLSLAFRFDSFDDAPERLHEEIGRGDAASPHVIEALVVRMLAVGARHMGAAISRPEWVSRVIAHIHLHAHEPLTNESLADIGAVPLSRLTRDFREHVGALPVTYIRDYRLRIAARALRHTERPVKDVALTHGFYDHAHFSRAFSKKHGMTPGEYRRRMRRDSAGGREGSEAKQ